jgi:hypothetical protein
MLRSQDTGAPFIQPLIPLVCILQRVHHLNQWWRVIVRPQISSIAAAIRLKSTIKPLSP